MWSAGCMLYIMLCGYPPFDGETQEEIFENILNGEVDFSEEEWNEVSEEGKDLVKALLTNENDRLTPKQALKHPWFKMNLKKAKYGLATKNHLNRLK